MNLQELQSAIASYRATATEEQLEKLQEMLSKEDDAINEQLEEIESERQEAKEEAERIAWESSDEGKEEAEHFRNAIMLWYRSEDKLVTVDGDRRRPNQWGILFEERTGFQTQEFIGTQEQVIHYVEGIVGVGTPYSPRASLGARSWRFRWFNYHDSTWLDQDVVAAA